MFTSTTFVAISICVLLSCARADSCENKGKFGAGVINDILLDSKESTFLKLKINNGAYDYCRSLKLESDELSYEEVSCDANVREWQEFAESGLEISLPSTDEYEALNETERADWIENADDTELIVTIDDTDANETILLEDIFIHPLYYAYFYSPSMYTLFIFTADQNDSISNASDDEPIQINLVSVSWNPNTVNETQVILPGMSVTEPDSDDYPADLTDFEAAIQYDIVGEAFEDGFPDGFEMILDGERWLNEDDYSLQIVRVNSANLGDCEDAEWIRYSALGSPYSTRKGNSSSVDPVAFKYIGHGFRGIDTRISRVYGFDEYNVWFYEGDLERYMEFGFETKELASYWGLMWLLIGVGVCFLCCGCFCLVRCCKKRRAQRETREQYFGTEMGAAV